jgi:hypothetical protein
MDLDSDTDSDSDDSLIPIVAFFTVQAQLRVQQRPTLRNWTGQSYVDNVLQCNNPARIRTVLRMELQTFNSLRDWLLENTNLRSSRVVSIEEKLFIFITIASSAGGLSNRRIQELYNKSARTISK